MELRVTIIGQRKNFDGIDFCVRDSEGGEWLIVNCLMKNDFYGFIGYFGSLGRAKGGYNEGHLVHLNRISDDNWIMLIE